ncbi:MAG: phosphatidylinositol mannoside acyltransferase [Deltaproteobacteria bacterium]|nr:phosphatidylinositol mannoside acyltransferase [Deltaproteobacteria bacterium]
MTASTSLPTWRAALCLVSLLPEAAARELGREVGYLFSFADRKRLRMAERHMGRVLGSGHDIRAAAREVFASYGRYWAELFWLRADRLGVVDQHVTLEGGEYLTAARQAGRGMILAVPHLGNWEIGARVLVERNIPVTVVAEALADRSMTEWFTATRRMLGMDVLLAAEGSHLAPALARRLRKGGAIALMTDRDLARKGLEVQFFGELTTLPAGPALLAELTGAALLPAAVYFRPGRGHRVVIRPPLEAIQSGSRAERRQVLAQQLAAAVEALVREAPTQWHLLQPNWPSDRRAL